MIRFLLVASLVVFTAGCRAVEPVIAPAGAPSTPTHENLHAVLWTQASVEYAATTQGIYAMAQHALDRALADTAWTADLAQRQTPGFGTLPPAIVLDVDETVLDNSPYQARLVRDDAAFTDVTWTDWVEERAAGLVPGADAYIAHARARGVTVFFVTNRDAEHEAATVANLEAFGITATDPNQDLVLVRGERPEWAMSDKEPRREAVRSRYRVLQYVGDNLGDFVSGERGSVAERAALVAPYAAWWGSRWIMLPNPQYGSWEGALVEHDYRQPADSLRARKYRQLNTLQ